MVIFKSREDGYKIQTKIVETGACLVNDMFISLNPENN
jgi:hypothetical protein